VWPGSPADLTAAWPKLFRPSMWAANISLGDSLATNELDSVDRIDFGNKPPVVLTAGKANADPKTAEFSQAFRKIWIERHEGLARLSSRGVHIIVPDTGHMIPYERPEAVIDAVNRVLDGVAK
jgi:pimeloyl-ACP methyl ester carboxylesterase